MIIKTSGIQLRDSSGKPLGQRQEGAIFYSGGELMDAVPLPREWGPWRLDTRSYVLYPVRPFRYEVDLERCLTSAQVLDYVVQIANKRWADHALVAGLIQALTDVLDPQGNLCSFGSSKRLTEKRVRELARAAARRRAEGFRVYPELRPGDEAGSQQ